MLLDRNCRESFVIGPYHFSVRDHWNSGSLTIRCTIGPNTQWEDAIEGTTLLDVKRQAAQLCRKHFAQWHDESCRIIQKWCNEYDQKCPETP